VARSCQHGNESSVSMGGGNLLTSCATLSFSRRIVLNGVNHYHHYHHHLVSRYYTESGTYISKPNYTIYRLT
jgi:hypothetical protein